MSLHRRRFLNRALWGSGALGLKALATGLPPAFILGRSMPARAFDRPPTYLILSSSHLGQPLNGNGPGSYPNNPDNRMDPLQEIGHPTSRDLGNGVLGTIGGRNVTVNDFGPVDLEIGDTTAKAAGVWSMTRPQMRARSSFIHHATHSNAHSEFGQVMQFHGAIVGPGGNGSEMFASFVAQETATELGTVVDRPINVGGSGTTYQGLPLGVYDPDELKALFGAGRHPTGVPNPGDISRLRDSVLDEVYKDVRANGTGTQRTFLDQYAQGRSAALELGDQLGPLLADVSGRSVEDEVRTAVALLRLNITPVVVMKFEYGGDNHQDNDLSREVEETISAMNALNLLWDELGAANLRDRVTFANLDVFGRTLKRNDGGGRDHNGDHHLMMLNGPHVRAGVVGGLERSFRGGNPNRPRDFGATAIGDVSRDQSLESAGKTVAKAVGIPDERIDARIRGGRVLTQALV